MSTSTASTPARQRKPRPKPARCIRLMVRPTTDSCGVVRITVGKLAADYILSAVPSDFGRAFLLTKVMGDHDAYHVCLDDSGSQCDCKGFHSAHSGECKHIGGLKALIEAGRL